MGFTYDLIVEEDLDALQVPTPDVDALAATWRAQAGDAPMPRELEPHVTHAWRRQWLAVHRSELLGDVEAARQWAWSNVGWRPLVDTVSGLQRFYSESPHALFSAGEALEILRQARAAGLAEGLDVAASHLERALAELMRFGLRFRFDFVP